MEEEFRKTNNLFKDTEATDMVTEHQGSQSSCSEARRSKNERICGWREAGARPCRDLQMRVRSSDFAVNKIECYLRVLRKCHSLIHFLMHYSDLFVEKARVEAGETVGGSPEIHENLFETR